MVNVLFWAVITAAFIGPGTITTAAKAGAGYGYSLIWALVFSTIATAVLQEASARVSIISGISPGQMLDRIVSGKWSLVVKSFIAFAIGFGCTAYEAGNIMGAVSGISLLTGLTEGMFILPTAILVGLILYLGTTKNISYGLGIMVAIMGFCFIGLLISQEILWAEMSQKLLHPELPPGSSLIVIALVGTTIVPYNIFLGARLAKGQSVLQMRKGLIPAILIGGLISISILILGVQMKGEFSFSKFGLHIGNSFGGYGNVFLGFGLLFAGFSSALAAPLAAQVTVKSLFNKEGFVWVWIVVVSLGAFFGWSGGSPVSVILLAQAINGFLLPIIVIFLYLAINDQRIMGSGYRNSLIANTLLLIIVSLGIFLGLKNIERVIETTISTILLIGIIGIVILYLLKKSFFNR
jgi:manganese transport protein